MHRQLPPLNALRAFSVTARTGSLVAAGLELGVTPSAVGHHISSLEKNLGVRLFDRRGKGLVLTSTGDRYAGLLSDGFDLLDRATDAVRREVTRRPIVVSATPAIALRWLAPTLDCLRQKGMAEFYIDASSREADLAAGEADIDIRYGLAVGPGLAWQVLFSESVFPVCHPKYAVAHELREPADLLGADLLFVDDWGCRGGVWSGWRDWCDTAGLEIGSLRETARFMEMDQAVSAAAAGEGVAVGAARHLEKHRSAAEGPELQRLFSPDLEVRYCAFIVALPEIAEEPTVRRLIRSLVAISRQTPTMLHEGAF